MFPLFRCLNTLQKTPKTTQLKEKPHEMIDWLYLFVCPYSYRALDEKKSACPPPGLFFVILCCKFFPAAFTRLSQFILSNCFRVTSTNYRRSNGWPETETFVHIDMIYCGSHYMMHTQTQLFMCLAPLHLPGGGRGFFSLPPYGWIYFSLVAIKLRSQLFRPKIIEESPQGLLNWFTSKLTNRSTFNLPLFTQGAANWEV